MNVENVNLGIIPRTTLDISRLLLIRRVPNGYDVFQVYYVDKKVNFSFPLYRSSKFINFSCCEMFFFFSNVVSTIDPS